MVVLYPSLQLPVPVVHSRLLIFSPYYFSLSCWSVEYGKAFWRVQEQLGWSCRVTFFFYSEEVYAYG